MVNENSLLRIEKGVTIYDPSRGIDNRTPSEKSLQTPSGRNLPSPSELARATVPFQPTSSKSKPMGSRVGGGYIYQSPGGGVTTAPQTISQQTQDQALTLARQNVNRAREGGQRDTNYYLQTKIPIGESYVSTPLGILDTKTKTYYSPVTGKEIGIESAVPKPKGFLEKAEQFFQRKTVEAETASLRKENIGTANIFLGGVGAGFVSPIISTIGFGGSLLTSPKETITNIPSGIKQSYEQITSGKVTETLLYNPGYALGFIGGSYITTKGISKGLSLGTKGIQNINKLINPNIVSIEKSGIKFVEGVTIPTEKSKLIKFEGKSIDTVHATFSPKLKYGSELQSFPEMATGSRKAIGQFNFYQSIPSEGKPVFYGGYVGIGEGGSSSITKFSLLEPKIKGFIFRGQNILETPKSIKSMDVKNIVKYQTITPGTYIPGENIKGISMEGQVTTSVGEVGKPLFKLIKNPEGGLYGKSTYYNIKRQAPTFIEKNKLLKSTFDILTSKNKRVYFMESKLEPLGKGTEFSPSKIVNTKELFESQNIKYISVSKSIKSSIPYIPSSSIRSSLSSLNYKSLGLSQVSTSSNISSFKPSSGYSGISTISSPTTTSYGGSTSSPGGSISSMFSYSSLGSPGISPSISKPPYIPPYISPSSEIKIIGKRYKNKSRKAPFIIAPSFTAIVENIKMKSTLKVSKTFGVTPFQTRGLMPAGSKKQYAKLTDL